MRAAAILHTLPAIDDVVVEGVVHEDDAGRAGQMMVVSVRVTAAGAGRCPHCDRRRPGYDTPPGPRRWRHLDMGASRCYLSAVAPRVRCAEHGVVRAAVPWARHDARMTLGSDSRLDGPTRIGIDEISYRKGHRYPTVVVDHTSGRLVWAEEGRTKETLEAFFDDLGKERSKALTHVSADGAEWIHAVVAERAPRAVRCLDPFHLILWCGKAVDKVRSRTVAGSGDAEQRRHPMRAVRKNPDKPTPGQRGALAELEDTNHDLYVAHLLKEQLREVVSTKGDDGAKLLAGWIARAYDSGIPEMIKLADTVTHCKPLILNNLHHGLSNARSKSTNTHLRAITKRSHGFKTPDALIGMAMLTRGGFCPKLPNRTH